MLILFENSPSRSTSTFTRTQLGLVLFVVAMLTCNGLQLLKKLKNYLFGKKKLMEVKSMQPLSKIFHVDQIMDPT